MLMVRPFDPADVLGDRDVAVCERSYGKDMPFRESIGDVDLSEYRDRTYGDIYPYLACFTAVRGHAFWRDCHAALLDLPEKFHRWFGDQEAIRNVVARGAYRVKNVPESVYGCLPDQLDPAQGAPCLIHFKGPERKRLLMKWADRLNLGSV